VTARTASQRNEGARQLLRTGHTQAEIASTLGVDRSLVCRWQNGERLPTDTQRLALKRAFKIPASAWDEELVTGVRKKKPASKHRMPRAVERELARQEAERESELEDERRPPAAVEITEASIRVRAELLARDIDRMREEILDDDSATPLERGKVIQSCIASLTYLGKITGHTLEINESRILRLPAWQRIKEAIVEALKPWPEARRALADRLKELGAET